MSNDMKKKIYLISRIYSPLYIAIETKSWKHTGIPAYYNFINHIEKDNSFDAEVIFLLDSNSKKHFKSGKYKFKEIKNPVRIVKYFSFKSEKKIIKNLEWLFNRILQYSFLFILLKRNSIYYLDRDNILLGNILNLKKGLIVYRLLGVTKKFYNIFFNKNILSRLFLRALKFKQKLIIATNDGSWSELIKKNLRDKNFYLMFNGSDFKKNKNIPKIKNILKISCISRLEPDKGCFELLNIFFLLKKKSIKFKVLIIGNGSLKNKILKKIHELDLNNEIELKGNLKHEKVEKYLKETDLFISYNYRGMFGNNVIEATSKGIPIIALDNDVLDDTYKKYFYVIKKNSYKTSVNFIEKFNSDLNLRTRYSDLSLNFFDQYIGTWSDRINKELNLINREYKKIDFVNSY
jgi:glycosyltransferase involved in cell wall biosynthesis